MESARTETAAACRATKLRPPTYPFDFVRTAALRALTERPAPCKLVAVAAPPGYGKTILLTQLFDHLSAEGSRDCLWVGLDDSDIALTSLLVLVETALGIGREEALWTLGYEANGTAGRVNRIVQHLASRATPLTLFLDNLDYCASGDVGGLLDALVFDTPDSVSVVVSSSSSTLPLDTGRALMELRLQAIGPAELSFDGEGIAALFESAGIAAPAGEVLATILEQSEGWPAAVRLMQVIMATDPGSGGDLAPLFHRRGQLADILSYRLLARFEPDLVEFLYQIAGFKCFTVEMLAAATGTAHAGRFVRYLVDNNVLIIPLDNRRQWFRLHTLFREFLIVLAGERLKAAARNAVLVRGALWLEERGYALEALDMAVKGGEPAMAARLLETLAWTMVRNRGDLPSFIVWVERARAVGTTLGTEAGFWHVWALIFNREYEAARKTLRAMETLIERASLRGPELRNLLAKSELAGIVLKVHLDELPDLRQAGPDWLSAHGDADSFESAAAAGALALACLADHRFAAARQAIRRSQAAVAGTTSLYGRAWVANILAMIEIGSGNLDEVEEPLAELAQGIDAEMGEGSVVGAVTGCVRARALHARGETVRAKALVEASLARAEGSGMLDFTWMGIETILPQALRGESVVTMAELRRIVAGYPRRLSLLFELTSIRLLVNQGRVEAAVQRAVDLGVWSHAGIFTMPDDAAMESDRAAAAMAGIALLAALGHFKKAEELIQLELHKAAEVGRRCAEVELFLAQAGLCVKAGRWRDALRAFSQAITAGAGRRLLQPFLERGSLVSHLMANCKLKELAVATMAETALIADVCGALGCGRPASMVAPAADPGESGDRGETFGSLTARELELLSMIGRGFDNMRIAEALSVSVRTVKWHLSNLYGKLDVKNRTGALAKARSLNLL